jgi:hypothetical protein
MNLMKKELSGLTADIQDVIAWGDYSGLTEDQSLNFVYGAPLDTFFTDYTQVQDNVKNLLTTMSVPVGLPGTQGGLDLQGGLGLAEDNLTGENSDVGALFKKLQDEINN